MKLTGYVCALFVAIFSVQGIADTVEIEGVLVHPHYAIGGETTGTAVYVVDGYYELELTSEEQQKFVEASNGEKVVAKGELRIEKGVEIDERRIITVDEITLKPFGSEPLGLLCGTEDRQIGVYKEGDKAKLYRRGEGVTELECGVEGELEYCQQPAIADAGYRVEYAEDKKSAELFEFTIAGPKHLASLQCVVPF